MNKKSNKYIATFIFFFLIVNIISFIRTLFPSVDEILNKVFLSEILSPLLGLIALIMVLIDFKRTVFKSKIIFYFLLFLLIVDWYTGLIALNLLLLALGKKNEKVYSEDKVKYPDILDKDI